MKKNKQLAATLATALAVTTLAGASAFAESRPANETRGRIERRDGGHRERDANRGESHRGDDSRRRENDGQANTRDNAQYHQRNRQDDRQSNGTVRGDSRDRNDSRHRSDDRSTNRGDYRNNNRGDNRGDYRNNSRNDNRGNDRSRSSYDRNRSNGSRQPYHVNGRISRVVRYGSGYRIWVGGASYPFFVPLAYYRGDRFRVGLSINLGGYYNPLGYYDYYDGAYDNRSYSRGDLRGVVESVDYRRDTFVVRSEASGSFVTVAMRRSDESVRPGDFVEVSGDWTRSGYFQAYDVDVLD